MRLLTVHWSKGVGVYDVVVVGGGPVGMVLANELALHDISAIVLEQRADVSEYPKAGTYHARAVATLARRGIVTVPRQTNDHTAMTAEPFQFAGYPWLTVRSRTIDGPTMLGIAQADLENAITRHAQSAGAVLKRQMTVASVVQEQQHVTVTATDRSGVEHSFTARYAVGADGGRSVLRQSGSFGVKEYSPTMRAILGLAEIPHPEQLRPGWSRTSRGWTLLNLNRYGKSRLIVFEFDGPIADRREVVTADEYSAAIDRVVGSHVDVVNPHYLNRFSDFSRIVTDYRDGRLFVAGDAAHIHYPLGGQGLNTGIVDAVNLGWKLAAVLSGAADEMLLDTYSAERQPVGQWLIDNTRLQSTLMNPAPEHDALRSVIAQLLCSVSQAHDWLADKVNGTSLRHPIGLGGSTELDGTFLPDHEVAVDGGRVSISSLLGDGKFLLLASPRVVGELCSDVSLPFTSVVGVEGLPTTYPEILVVRPDGYIAWAGNRTSVDSMLATLKSYFRLRCA